MYEAVCDALVTVSESKFPTTSAVLPSAQRVRLMWVYDIDISPSGSSARMIMIYRAKI